MAENGRLPDSDLRVTYLYYPGTANGRRLTKEAADRAEAMALAFMLHFNKPLYATDGYRDIDTQWVVWRKWLAGTGAPAAEPGTSNHGWGEALDLASNINSFSSAEHKWMRENAPKFGWRHPYWAREGGGRQEAWHWEFVGGGKTGPRIQRPKAGEIGLGSSGAQARKVQGLLNDALKPQNEITVDGDFGLMSALAVVKYQSSRGLAVTGRVGAKTLARLEGRTAAPEAPRKPTIYLKPGTSNEGGTKALQRFLNRYRPAFNLVVDGDYGDATEAAVKYWQRKAGMKPTGVIGSVSRARLVELGVFDELED